LAIECSGLQDPLAREVLTQLNSDKLSCKTNEVHLTFDDGPAAGVSPKILDSLKSRDIKATFFITTTSLENSPSNRAIVKRIFDEGHLVANHGYNHNAYALRMDGNGKILDPGFNLEKREEEISKSIILLNQATGDQYSKQKNLLFRFPYGRGAMPSAAEIEEMSQSGEIKFSSSNYADRLKEYRQMSPPLQTLAGNNHSHLGWNHDSKDSSYGVKMPDDAILKNYIVNNLKALCTSNISPQVALFHDIKEMNIKAIPIIADIGKCAGLNFISSAELLKMPDTIVKSGVYIPKEKIKIGTVENVIKTMDSVKSAGLVNCEENKVISCHSQYTDKYYADCEGDESICYQGKWYKRQSILDLVDENYIKIKDACGL
jgi:peptidoglycan/xylan/chitin deacetylase (PgdA/CDA1 family)